MRFIVVTGAKAKNHPHCIWCLKEIVDRYVRDVSTRQVFCSYKCYARSAKAMPVLTFLYPKSRSRTDPRSREQGLPE